MFDTPSTLYFHVEESHLSHDGKALTQTSKQLPQHLKVLADNIFWAWYDLVIFNILNLCWAYILALLVFLAS